MKVEELLAAALNLSDVERLYLGTRMVDSVSFPMSESAARMAEMFQELDRRVANWKDAARAEEEWQDS